MCASVAERETASDDGKIQHLRDTSKMENFKVVHLQDWKWKRLLSVYTAETSADLQCVFLQCT